MKKTKLKLSVYFGVMILFGVIAVFGSVMAYQSYANQPPKVVVEGNYIEAATVSNPTGDVGGMLGAANPIQVTPLNCSNNDCTYYAEQTFIDASTTIISIPDPFLQATSTGAGSEVVLKTDDSGQAWTGATATVAMARLYITGPATTSFKLACGAYTSGIGAALPLTRTIVSTTPALAGDSIPTSSVGVMENNVSAAQGAMYDAGTTSKIMVGSDAPYFVCVVSGVNNAAFTNNSNTFDGHISVRFVRTKN